MGDPTVMKIVASALLFLLVFCMSATVDVTSMLNQLKNKRAILTGVFLQFFVLPLLGYIVVLLFDFDHTVGVTLLVVTSSPGGSYSNWWCSVFNADLALSVTMTAVSTVLSVLMLPLNLALYANAAYEDNVIENLDWVSLLTSLVVVIGAISLGLLASAKHKQCFPTMNTEKFHRYSNHIGSLVGIALMIFSGFISNTDEDNQIWERNWQFYVGTALPCVLGLLLSNVVTTCVVRLRKPERVTASIECCYQNVGIATSVAMAMFQGDDRATAMGIPFFYGIVEIVVLGIYCLIVWKMGWTKAPRDEKIWVIIATSYEVAHEPVQDGDKAEGMSLKDLALTEKDDDEEDVDIEKPMVKDEVSQDPPETSERLLQT